MRFIGVDGRIYKIPMPFHGILICCRGEKCLTGPGKGSNAIAHDTVGRKGRREDDIATHDEDVFNIGHKKYQLIDGYLDLVH